MQQFTEIGTVGVDSGQILITDPCYIDSEWQHPTKKDKDNSDFKNKKNKGKYSYQGCCNATLSKEMSGQLNYELGHAGAGVAVTSGCGDGNYPVFATYNKKGKISRIIIDFLTDTNDEHDDWLNNLRTSGGTNKIYSATP